MGETLTNRETFSAFLFRLQRKYEFLTKKERLTIKKDEILGKKKKKKQARNEFLTKKKGVK